MSGYRELLAIPGFRRLWLGSTVSALGDGATWIALSWMVYERTASPTAVGLLVFAYGAPVLVGGLVTGPLLDRFDAFRIMQLDSIFRGAVMASIPFLALSGEPPLAALYAVAAVYGLLKMVPLAGVPTVLPLLVPEDRLSTANAMEGLTFSISGVVGPLLAGAIIASAGAVNVLVLDAVTFVVFALSLHGLRDTRARDGEAGSYRLREGLAFVRSSPPIALTTVMFASFNVGIGVLLVVLPVYATTVAGGGATAYALFTSAFVAGDFVASFAVGWRSWGWPLGRSIAVAQTSVAVVFLPLVLQPGVALTAALLFGAGVFTAPLTIWAQTLRMRIIPADVRGRVFSLLRTFMQAAEPLGGAAGGAVIATGGLAVALVGVVAAVGVPGVVGIRSRALAPEQAP